MSKKRRDWRAWPRSGTAVEGPRRGGRGLSGGAPAPGRDGASVATDKRRGTLPGNHGRQQRGAYAKADVAIIYGYHSVRQALRSPRRETLRIFATEAAAARLGEELAAKALTPQIVSADEIAARLLPHAVHQGVLLEARPLAPIDISELPADGLVVVLDQITDPHNVGAILRTAAAFGVDAIVTTERHSPEFTGVLAKSASGGLEHVAVASVKNLSRALTELGELGYWRVGLDAMAPVILAATPLRRPLAVVFGAEGKGLRRLTRETCDAIARLDFPGAIKSLNVSNACAVALTLIAMRFDPARD